MRIALGPLQDHWSRERVFQFYESVAHSVVAIVYVGQPVRLRGNDMRLADWLNIANRLRDAGKEVVLCAHVLLESGSTINASQAIVTNGDFHVEANDMDTVLGLAGRTAFVAGPHLNIRNRTTMELMLSLGAIRWVKPLEMVRQVLFKMQMGRPQGLQTEVFVHCRIPQAFPAGDCAPRKDRHFGEAIKSSKPNLLDWLMTQSQKNGFHFALNGTRMRSAKITDLILELTQMSQLGIDVIRLNPQEFHMSALADLFHRLANSLDLQKDSP